ncbi:hypothetical protein Nmel_000994, partial [Mimus melanotis]
AGGAGPRRLRGKSAPWDLPRPAKGRGGGNVRLRPQLKDALRARSGLRTPSPLFSRRFTEWLRLKGTTVECPVHRFLPAAF